MSVDESVRGIDALESRVEQLEQQLESQQSTGGLSMSRRSVLGSLAGVGLGAAGMQYLTEPATAQTSAVGQLGDEDNRIDVFGSTGDFKTLEPEELNNTIYTIDPDWSQSDIQDLIDDLHDDDGGIIIPMPGSYIIGNPALTLRSNVAIDGLVPGAATFQLDDDLNDNATSVINFEENATDWAVRNIEIDGNESNNRNIDAYPDAPSAHGLYIENSDGHPKNGEVENVHIHDTIKSNLVAGGVEVSYDNIRLKNSAEDHNLYISRGKDQSFGSINADGFSRGSAVAIGVDNDDPATGNKIEYLHLTNPETTPSGEYPDQSVHYRTNDEGYGNEIDTLVVEAPDDSEGWCVNIRQRDTKIGSYIYRGGASDEILTIDKGNNFDGIIEVESTRVEITQTNTSSATDAVFVNSRDVILGTVEVIEEDAINYHALALEGADRSVERAYVGQLWANVGEESLRLDGSANDVKGVIDEFEDMGDTGIEETGSVSTVVGRDGVFTKQKAGALDVYEGDRVALDADEWHSVFDVSDPLNVVSGTIIGPRVGPIRITWGDGSTEELGGRNRGVLESSDDFVACRSIPPIRDLTQLEFKNSSGNDGLEYGYEIYTDR